MRNSSKGFEQLFWSIAFPGFGQILNRKYLKGIVLIALEFIVNIKANVNTLIVLSFLGQTEAAVLQADYQWLMFYPCLYIFGIWDAFRDAREEDSPWLFLPFAFAAYMETLGVVYSKTFRINGALLGPIFLPMLGIFLGLGIGFVLRRVLLKRISV